MRQRRDIVSFPHSRWRETELPCGDIYHGHKGKHSWRDEKNVVLIFDPSVKNSAALAVAEVLGSLVQKASRIDASLPFLRARDPGLTAGFLDSCAKNSI